MAENRIYRQEDNQQVEPSPDDKLIELRVPKVSFLVNEAVNTLRGNIQLSGYNIKTVALTSAVIHEGKSTLSFRLALSFAALGKRTIYVDCDIRNSKTLFKYGIRNKQIDGLTKYLCGNCEMVDIVYHTTEPYLDMICTGSVAPNPSELFSSELFQNLIAALRDAYDYVIVDTPPINAVIDGVLITKECDGTILVVESGITDRTQVQHMKEQLEYANIKILGVVLNKVGTKESGYGYGTYGKKYGYGRKYGYGYGYGYGNTGEESGNHSSKKKKKKK